MMIELGRVRNVRTHVWTSDAPRRADDCSLSVCGDTLTPVILVDCDRCSFVDLTLSTSQMFRNLISNHSNANAMKS